MNVWKHAVFFIGLLIAIGNFFPSTPLWGFNYYFLSVPYGADAEWLGILAVLYFSTFPYYQGAHYILDGLYIFATFVACLFLFNLEYRLLIAFFKGVNPYDAHKELYGEEYAGNSIYFGDLSQLFLCTLFIIYLGKVGFSCWSKLTEVKPDSPQDN